MPRVIFWLVKGDVDVSKFDVEILFWHQVVQCDITLWSWHNRQQRERRGGKVCLNIYNNSLHSCDDVLYCLSMKKCVYLLKFIKEKKNLNND